MDWVTSRERLGAELIGARERVVERHRQLLRERGLLSRAIEGCAAELVLQAGAALADGDPPEAPWTRCGGLLRLEARPAVQQLAAELSTLFAALVEQLGRLSFSEDEERAAAEVLALQLEAALRGASAEEQEAWFAQPVEDPALRFGGVKLVCFAGRPAPPGQAAAA
jgi:hypothetical protein